MKLKLLKFPQGTQLPTNNKLLTADFFDIEKLGNSDWFRIDNKVGVARQMGDPLYVHVSGVYFNPVADAEAQAPVVEKVASSKR